MPGAETEYLSFDRVADLYEETRYVPPECLREAARLLIEAGRLAPGDPFLDAGVGTARFARVLAAEGVRVVGVDVSPGMLRQARATSPSVALVRADLRALPLPTGAFAGALIVHILHLIADWRRVVAEARRVLAPGASLFVGSEGGKRFLSRSTYFQIAEEWGLTRPRLGAPSFDAIREHLTATSAELTQVDEGRIRWTASARAGDMLETCRRNLFSDLWHLPEEVHADLGAEAERRLLQIFGSLDEVEEVPAHLAFWRVTWPTHNERTDRAGP